MDAPIRKGIDAVYEFSSPPPKYVVAEVKMNTTGSKTWKPKVSTKTTASGGSQMTSKWVEFNLRMEFDPILARSIYKNHQKVLVGISKKYDIIIETLNKSGKTVKNNITILK